MRWKAVRRFADQSGTAAIEFAIIAPVLMLFLLGIVCFGLMLGTYNAVQQLAAEAARASVAGLSDSERNQIANSYVSSNIAGYQMIDPSKLIVATYAQPDTYRVTLSYDVSNTVVYKLSGVFKSFNPIIILSASIKNGGF